MSKIIVDKQAKVRIMLTVIKPFCSLMRELARILIKAKLSKSGKSDQSKKSRFIRKCLRIIFVIFFKHGFGHIFIKTIYGRFILPK